MFKSLVLFALALCVAQAAIAREPQPEKPEKFKGSDGCYISEIDGLVPFGQSLASKKECKEYRCSENEIIHVTCGAVHIQPHCSQVVERHLLYPDCCPKERCPN